MAGLEYTFVTRQVPMHMKVTLLELQKLYQSRGEQKKITAARLDCVLCGPHHRLLVARDNGRLVGCAVINYAEELPITMGVIHGVIVRSSHKKKGVKEGLISALKKAATERGVKRTVVI